MNTDRVSCIAKRKRQRYLLLFVFVILVSAAGIYMILGRDRGLRYSYYEVVSGKVTGEPLHLVALSDLHNTKFGEDNEELIEKVREAGPDVILLLGDMIDADFPDVESLITLCGEFRKIAPVFYGIGNHECTVMYEDRISYRKQLEKMDIHLLENQYYTLDLRGNRIDIGGITTSETRYDDWSKDFVRDFTGQDPDHLKIMISHFPSLYYEKMAEEKIDINLSGHFHGGIFRIPGLGGVFSKHYGLFPKYCSGEFELKSGKLFVSRGLSRKFPRFFNDPEIMVIDVRPE